MYANTFITVECSGVDLFMNESVSLHSVNSRNWSSLSRMCPSIPSQELSPCPLFPYCSGMGAGDTDPMIGGLLCMHTQSSQMQRQSPDNKETLERYTHNCQHCTFPINREQNIFVLTYIIYIRQSDIDSLIQYSYDCSWSWRRPQKVDKRMVLEHTHGSFIT
jgi:hypothetical protein